MTDAAPVVVLTDRFPELTETFVLEEVRALRRLGVEVHVEALAAAPHPADVHESALVWEHETRGHRLRALARLSVRHPFGCLRDVGARRRWRREETVVPLRMLAPAAVRARRARHIHVHFAAGAALAALRIARITRVPFSVTAHAYDIYQRPANLTEKLQAAAFATSGCSYTVRDVQALAGRETAVHRIVMGVDGSVFSRRTGHPGGRTIVAVGRLVPKKGFGDLVDAVAIMRERGQAPDRVLIAGDGPLRKDLEERVRRAGLAHLVQLAGPLGHGAVRELLEEADVLCMPSVVAPDGDRDSMPVVVKEALAMEVPVVGTDEVGLPELIRPEFGRLVAPHDPQALATALAETLDHDVHARARMGRAGRAFVLEACDVDRETARLLELIREAARPGS